MKKYLLISLSIICIITLFAQKTLNVFKKDLTVMNVVVNSVDSVKFSSDGADLNIHTAANQVLTVPVSSVDSITFSDSTLQSLPVVSTWAVTAVSYATAQSGLTIHSVGGTSITEKGICWGLTPNPTLENNKIISTATTASSTLNLTGLTDGSVIYIRAFATNAAGTSYGEQQSLTTTAYALPVVETVSAVYDYNNNRANCVVNIKSNGGCGLTERGICWSTSKNPTIANSKHSYGTTTGQFYAQMSNLSLNATYYVRAFATNCKGTAYGNELVVKPLLGNVTYTLAVDQAAYPEYHRLIKIAMDSACYYFNRYTAFRGNIYVYYNAGIPTAQASYKGSIGFGSNTRYMWVGTAIHEIAHYLGSGTTTVWKSKVVNGIWTGTNGTNLLKSFSGEVLKGDAQHYWPYGINQKEEITNLGNATVQTNAMVFSVQLIKAMVVDDCGLPLTW